MKKRFKFKVPVLIIQYSVVLTNYCENHDNIHPTWKMGILICDLTYTTHRGAYIFASWHIEGATINILGISKL